MYHLKMSPSQIVKRVESELMVWCTDPTTLGKTITSVFKKKQKKTLFHANEAYKDYSVCTYVWPTYQGQCNQYYTWPILLSQPQEARSTHFCCIFPLKCWAESNLLIPQAKTREMNT